MSLTAAQINTIYIDTLQRSATSAEQTTWVNLDTSGLLTDATVIADIITSPEAVNFTWLVTRLYQADFGRVPDQAGLKANVNALKSGAVTELQLDSAFLLSAESIAKYGVINPGASIGSLGAQGTAFLQALYNNVLGRLGVAQEITNWESTGESAAQILMGFADSTEFQNKANPAIIALETANALSYTITTGSLFNNPSNPSAGTTFTLTPSADNFTTGQGSDTYNAPVFFNAPSGTFFDTLNNGDTIKDSGTGNALNAVFGAGVANTGVSTGVTVQGVQAWNISNTGGGASVDATGGATAGITGQTSLALVNSIANFQEGGVGAGLGIGSLLTGISATNDIGGIAVIADISAALFSGTNAIAVTATGDGAAANDFFFVAGPDAGATGYGVWNVSATGTDFLALGTTSATNAKTLTVAGAGNVELDAVAVANFAKLATVDLSASTGNVYVSGLSAGATNQIGGLGGGVGLLDGVAGVPLTVVKAGTGNDIVDLSGLTTAQLAAITTLTGAATGGTGIDTLILPDANVKGTAVVNAGMTGWAFVGDPLGGGGTINMSNLPGASGIQMEGNQAGNETINNAGTTFNLALGTSGLTAANNSWTVNQPGTSTANVLNFSMGTGAVFSTAASGNVNDQFQNLVFNNADAVNMAFAGKSTNAGFDQLGAEVITAPAGGGISVTMTGNQNIALSAPGIAPGNVAALTLNAVNGSSVVDNDTGILLLNPGFNAATSILLASAATNVPLLNASASGGLIMDSGDSFNSLGGFGTSGVSITGSATKSNVIQGSVGNDNLTGGSGTDTIATNGGGDTIALGTGHTGDLIELYITQSVVSAAAGIAPGTNIAAVANLAVNGTNDAGAGFWGVAPGVTQGAGTLISTLFTDGGGTATFGTSADQAKVAGFTPGAAGDAVEVSKSAEGGLLITATGTTPATGNAAIQLVNSTGVEAGTNDVFAVQGASFASAAALAQALKTGTYALSAGTALAAGSYHELFLYTDNTGSPSVHLADISFTTAGGSAVFSNAAFTNIAGSDLVQLTGIAQSSIVNANIHLVV